MKKRNILLTIIYFVILLHLYSTKTYAIVARVVYDPLNVTISNILKFAPIFFIVAYIIGSIIYYILSKQDKNYKIKKLIIWFSILAIIGAVSYLCSGPVLNEGAKYSSSQIDFKNWKRNIKNEK